MKGLVYTAEVAASGRSPSADEASGRIRKADTAVAHLLRISEGAEIIVRHQNRYVDGLPWSLQTSYYPRSLSHRAPRRWMQVLLKREPSPTWQNAVSGRLDIKTRFNGEPQIKTRLPISIFLSMGVFR
jgi:hypothetical protein